MILLAFLALALDPPADAPAPTQALHDVVVSAIRNCPQTHGDEIAVCAKDRGFSEKYRIERLTKPETNLESAKLKLSGVADTGNVAPGGCIGAAGQAGAIGCSKRDYDDWAAWKRKQKAEAKSIP